MREKTLLEVAMMLGDAIDKLNAWIDYSWGCPDWTLEAEEYRIKPKTKTLYKWVISYDDKEFMETAYFHATLLDVENNCADPKYIKRLDYTAIEVEA